MSSDFRSVPVVDVHSDNFKDLWPSLTLAIKSATFVAIDTELSGLGNKRVLNAKCIDDRYAGVSNVAKTRSIISLGLSCFKLNNVTEEQSCPDDASSDKTVSVKRWSFLAQTFNIAVLCSEDYVVEPSSLKFLIGHGFDFNKQYATGLTYYRGNDTNAKPSLSVRDLFSVLLEANAPVVFHNALVDIIFLYQSFYADLPPSCSTFVADLTEMYGGGVYDTKYITEYRERLTASYLEFVFRKCQRTNAFRSDEGRTRVCLEFAKYPDSCSDVTQRCCSLPSVAVELGHIPNKEHLKKILCHVFASHGWCTRDTKCHQSHDIDMIIDMEGIRMAKRRRKRKRRHNHGSGDSALDGDDADKANVSDNCSEADDDADKANVSDNCSEADVMETQCEESEPAVEVSEQVETIMSPVSKQPRISTSQIESVNDCKENVKTTKNSDPKSKISDPKSKISDTKSKISDPISKISDQKSNCDEVDFSMTTASEIDASKSSITISCPEVQNGRKSEDLLVEEARSGGHRAGYDAFMTGFSMAFFAAKYGKFPKTFSGKISLSDLGLDDMQNKIYLCGKDIPLSISKSAFTKTSKNHREKFQKLRHPREV